MTTPGARLHLADLVHAEGLSHDRSPAPARPRAARCTSWCSAACSLPSSAAAIPRPSGSDIVVSKDDIARIAAGFASTWQRPPIDGRAEGGRGRRHSRSRSSTAPASRSGSTRTTRSSGAASARRWSSSSKAPSRHRRRATSRRSSRQTRTSSARSRSVAFRQVFVSAKREGAQAEAEALLPQLVSGGSSAQSVGDATLLPATVDLAPLSEIAAQFGVGFAKGLTNAKPGTWTGPIASAYGYHLVLVTRAEPARLPALGEVRPAVEREWFAERRKEVLDARYGELKARYAVRFEGGVSAQ